MATPEQIQSLIAECNLLAAWPKPTMTSKELADHLSVDQVLIIRLMRALGIFGIFNEIEDEVYEHNALSNTMSTPGRGGFFSMAQGIREISRLPEYLAEFGYGNPGTDPDKPSLFSWLNNTDLEFFEWMVKNQDKSRLNKFNETMARSMDTDRAVSGQTFLDSYPFEKELADAPPDENVIVDVGGGYGQVLREIRARLPQVKGRLVLEDLPETLKGAGGVVPTDNVAIQGYNFFTQEQPIKGARIYMLRHVLHDWPDHACKKILQNTIPALVKGKSKIMVVEVILSSPDPDELVFGSLMDFQMMKYGGMGRKERQWRALIESAGLKVVKIWPAIRHDRIIEAVPKDW